MKLYMMILVVLLSCNRKTTGLGSRSSLANGGQQASAQAGYDITAALPAGHVTDGSVDYTDVIQAAMNKHSSLLFPQFPVLIRGLQVNSNKNIVFPEGSVLVMKPTSNPFYSVLKISNVKNITLVNPVIRGERKGHMGTTGQWGMGIGIFSSENISVSNPKVSDCWGDGIYVGKSDDSLSACRNIIITNAECRNNRRNGISVISVDGLKLISPYIESSNGHLPMAGIDIEPDHGFDIIKNVVISKPVTRNNQGEGILIYLCKLYENRDKQIGITIDDHNDTESDAGLRVIAYRLKPTDKAKVTGTISVSNPSWKNSKKRALIATEFTEPGMLLKLQKVKIENRNSGRLGRRDLQKEIVNSIGGTANYVILD